MYVIETRDLTKKFDGRKAVDNLNLTIKKGELFGLLGPNGAGKSTTVAMLSTILEPTSGTAIIGGYDIRKNPREVRKIIGVVPQEGSIYDDLTAVENLTYFGKLHGIEEKKLKERIEKLLDLVQLQNRTRDRVKTFSSGMKHRLNLAVGLIHEPEVLFLDEPTTGLDPAARLVVWEFIKQLQDQGITILLTTHYMDEADYLCDRVAFMDRGRVVALGTPAELKRSIGELEAIEIKTARKVPKTFHARIGKLRGVRKAERTSEGLRLLALSADTLLAPLARLASEMGVSIVSLNITQPTLEDVFIKLTGKTLRD